MPRKLRTLWILAACCTCWVSQSFAQSQSSGMFGSRNLGSGSGLTAGNRTFSGGSGSGSRQTLGQSQQLGGGNAVLGRTLQNDQSGGINSGARFMRQNRTGQFVGSDAADVNAALGALGGANQRGLNALTQQLRGNNRQQRSAQPNQGANFSGRRQQPVFRFTREADFTNQPVKTAALSERLTQRVMKSQAIQAESPVQVVIRGRTAILRGSVASDRARDLAARLVLLEPGVDDVDNQLTVSDSQP